MENPNQAGVVASAVSTAISSIPVSRIGDIHTEGKDNLIVATSDKTGASRITLKKQKDFIREERSKNPELSLNGAKKLFQAYRVENATAFTQRVAGLMLAGKVLVQSATANKNKELRGVQFMNAKDSDATRTTAAEAQLIKMGTITQEQLDAAKRAVAAAKAVAKKNTVDVNATPVAPTLPAPANPEAVSTEAQAEPVAAVA